MLTKSRSANYGQSVSKSKPVFRKSALGTHPGNSTNVIPTKASINSPFNDSFSEHRSPRYRSHSNPPLPNVISTTDSGSGSNKSSARGSVTPTRNTPKTPLREPRASGNITRSSSQGQLLGSKKSLTWQEELQKEILEMDNKIMQWRLPSTPEHEPQTDVPKHAAMLTIAANEFRQSSSPQLGFNDAGPPRSALAQRIMLAKQSSMSSNPSTEFVDDVTSQRKSEGDDDGGSSLAKNKTTFDNQPTFASSSSLLVAASLSNGYKLSSPSSPSSPGAALPQNRGDSFLQVNKKGSILSSASGNSSLSDIITSGSSSFFEDSDLTASANSYTEGDGDDDARDSTQLEMPLVKIFASSRKKSIDLKKRRIEVMREKAKRRSDTEDLRRATFQDDNILIDQP
eukprot:c9233_g1_i1.p1 GENE.c9233_g1_i1~~c9233_g1_i1.p1  ORF type:complete len:398 (-),score=78.55 c9233_g1_i1:45-1238(-)